MHICFGSEVLGQHLLLIIPIDLSGIKCFGAHVPYGKLFFYLPLWGLTEILSSLFSPSDCVMEMPIQAVKERTLI